MNEQKIDPENAFPCKECGKIYGDQTGMLIHFLQFHRSVRVEVALEQFVCSVCDSKFMSYNEFQNHLEQHKLVYLYCKHCNFKCTFESTLVAHINKHTSEKNLEDIVECLEVEPDIPDINNFEMASYTCSDCGESFHRYMNLKWHLLTHGEKKYYSCSDCDYKTIYHYNFKLHFKQHSGSTQYVCSECDFKTTNNKDFLEHKNIHATNDKKLSLRKYRKINDSPEPPTTSSYVSLSYFTASCKQSLKSKANEPKKYINNKIISNKIKKKPKPCQLTDKNHNINVEKSNNKLQYENFNDNEITVKKSKNLLLTKSNYMENYNKIVEISNSEPQSGDLNKTIVVEKAKHHPLFNDINDSGISVEISENELTADETHKIQIITEPQTNSVNNNINSNENSKNEPQSHHIKDGTIYNENSKEQLQSTKIIANKYIHKNKNYFHNTAKRETTKSSQKHRRKRNGQFAKKEDNKNHKDLSSTLDMKETSLRKRVYLKRKSALPYKCSYCLAGCASLEQIKLHKEMHNIPDKYQLTKMDKSSVTFESK